MEEKKAYFNTKFFHRGFSGFFPKNQNRGANTCMPVFPHECNETICTQKGVFVNACRISLNFPWDVSKYKISSLPKLLFSFKEDVFKGEKMLCIFFI